jgi:hypothetical protein
MDIDMISKISYAMYSHLYSLTLKQPEDCSCLVISMSVPYNEATYKQLEGKEKQQISHELDK